MNGNLYKYSVAPQDVDFTKRIKLANIFSQILNTAGIDADNSGIGVLQLNKINSSWVLLRICFEMERLPDEYEKYTLSTWVNDFGKLFTTRNFLFTDAEGKRFGATVSQWAMLNLITRKPCDIREIGGSYKLVEEPSPLSAPAKILPFEPQSFTQHKVAYSDIDFNHHMNSVRYLELAIDLIPIDLFTNAGKWRFNMNFLHEIRYGETISIGYKNDEVRHLFEIKNSENKPTCRISIEKK